jgi:hypothetical protein
LLRKAIAPDEATLDRRAKQAAASVKMDMRDTADAVAMEALVDEKTGPIRQRDLDRLAAIVRSSKTELQRDRKALLPKLAAAARMRLFENDPPGAKWKALTGLLPAVALGLRPGAVALLLEFYTRESSVAALAFTLQPEERFTSSSSLR